VFWRLPEYPNRGKLRAGWNGSAGVERSVLGWTGRRWLRLSGLGAWRDTCFSFRHNTY